MQHSLTEFDLFFLSYDEPNCEANFADLLDKAPWAQRVHGVKGFDAAHRAAAEKSETDWFITVDADNIVDPAFFDETIDLDQERRPNESVTWNGRNMMNGLVYGNGGVKLWSKAFVLSGGVGHETSDDPRHAVDFCWQPDYRTIHKCFSEVWNNGSAFQAWRVGFREGVKLTLDGGLRVPAKEMKTRLHPMNLRNIRIWCSVGLDVENGIHAMLGARHGLINMLNPSWNHVQVRDYDWFETIQMPDADYYTLEQMGREIERETGILIPVVPEESSAFFREMMLWRNE
jgi:hypothetical protein